MSCEVGGVDSPPAVTSVETCPPATGTDAMLLPRKAKAVVPSEARAAIDCIDGTVSSVRAVPPARGTVSSVVTPLPSVLV